MWTVRRRVVTRLGSAASLLLVVGGIPYGQLLYLGWPLPTQAPTLDQLRAGLTGRNWLTDAALVDGLAVLLWLLWLLFTLSVAVEVVAAVRGVRAPRFRLLAPTQGLAAGLVAGLTASIVAAAPAPPLDPHAPGPAPVASSPAAVHVAAPVAAPIAETTAGHAAAMTPAVSRTQLVDRHRHEHTVVRGESLWLIAQHHLGDPERWPEIWHLNKGRSWPHVSGRTTLHHPDLIFPGWVLTLPAGAPAPPTPPRDTPAAPPSPGSPPATPTAPATTSPQPTPPTQPSLTMTAPGAMTPDNDGVINPPGHIPATATPTAASPSPTTADATPSRSATAAPAPPSHPDGDDPAPASPPDWIDIVGGYISVGLAAGLLYAAAMAWRRRRHRYQPTPITDPVLADPDLATPLAASTRLRQTLRRSAPHLLDQPTDPGPTVREYATAEVKPPLPPVGPTGAELAGVGALPVAAGLGLAGPAAVDAARALLVATLTAGTAEDPDAQSQAIIPASTLATLLGVSAVDLGPMHRLQVASTFADALTTIEEEIIRRSRLIADQESADIPALRAHQTLAEPLPQMLLIADVPDDTWHARLTTAIRLGEKVAIGAALIGAWPGGTTLTVAPDGTTTGGDGQRVAVLNPAAATQILTLLREAHGDAPAATAAPPTRSRPAEPPAPPTSDREPADTATAAPVPPPRPVGPPPDVRAGDPVAVRILGEPAILTADGTPVRGLRAKSLELLVYLAIHRAGAPLADIMEAIWPDATLRRASERLSTCVANLRRVIRTAAQPAPSDHPPPPGIGTTSTTTTTTTNRKVNRMEPVVNTGGHYHLDPTLVRIDWWTVRDAYAQVATAPDDTARLTHLRRAIAAAGGNLADGTDYEWIDTDREHVRRHLIKIHAQTADLLTEADPRQTRDLYETACDLDPLSDELARRAMRAAATVGDADTIRHRLAKLRRALDDTGIDIDPDTEHLATALLRDLTKP